MTDYAVAIGNGESRKHIDIDSIRTVKVGCNAIMRDYVVDHLVCVDRRMVKEAIDRRYPAKTYTRKDWLGQFPEATTLPDLPFEQKIRADEPFQWGSGPYAVYIASQLCSNIILLGFDLYSQNKKVNNIYKDTQGYDESTKHAVDPRYWIHQIGSIFHYYKHKNFVVLQKDNWDLPESWIAPNLKVDTLSNIKYYI